MSADATPAARPEWARFARPSLVVGVVALLVTALGALVSPAEFFRSYLVAFNFWLGIALGCLVLVMMQHLTGGAWGLLLRRALESATRTLPLFVIFFMPLVFGRAESDKLLVEALRMAPLQLAEFCHVPRQPFSENL